MTRSSVAPNGKSTTGTGFLIALSFPPILSLALSSSQIGQVPEAAFGSQAYTQSCTELISGSNAASARTAVDFPVPRSPITKTPPTLESRAAIKIANFISSCPTIAEKG